MKTLLMLVAVLLITFPGPAPATHIDRGCRPAPVYMQVPHWVQDELCKPVGTDGSVHGISVFMRGQDGEGHEMIALYLTLEAANDQDMDKLIGVLVFAVDPDTGRRQRLLMYRSNTSDRIYNAPPQEMPPGLSV